MSRTRAAWKLSHSSTHAMSDPFWGRAKEKNLMNVRCIKRRIDDVFPLWEVSTEVRWRWGGLLTEQLSVWSGLWGRMKDWVCRGPSQCRGPRAGFLQLVRITKKWVGVRESFLERRDHRDSNTAASCIESVSETCDSYEIPADGELVRTLIIKMWFHIQVLSNNETKITASSQVK